MLKSRGFTAIFGNDCGSSRPRPPLRRKISKISLTDLVEHVRLNTV